MDSSSGFQQQQSGYDPSSSSSQTQTYDQSSQPYYAFSNAHDPTSLPIAPQPPHSAEPSNSHTHAPLQPAPVPGSLNPAAVAVVAGALANLVGNNVDGVPMEQIGPSQYRGRGRRGGRSFRGYGRRFRGRGRGRGGDFRDFSLHSSEPTVNVADAPTAEGATSVIQQSPVSGQSTLPNLAQVPSAPMQAPPCKFWCEICKAECNTPEMLEQHKNGKRHKKNLRVHEELQRLKVQNEQQSGNISTSQSNLTVQPEKVSEAEKEGLAGENMSSEATHDNHNDKTELQSNVAGVSEVQTEEPQDESTDKSIIQGHGFKRKMGGGRGGKYMRSDDGSRKPVEPSKHKQIPYFICELCNVKCDSQVVYNSHLIGKKHLQNFKRVHGHQALNGEAGIQPLHPPLINPLSNANNFPVQQGVTAPLGITDPRNLLAQILMTVLSNVQVPSTAQLSGPVAAQIQAPTLTASSSHEPLSQNLSTQVSDSLAHVESEDPNRETKEQMSSVMMQLNEIAGSSNNEKSKTADGKSTKEESMLKLPQDSSVMTPADNTIAANKQLPS